MLAILAAIAKQLWERVTAGLNRAKAQGKALGRPKVPVHEERVAELRKRGLSIREIAEETAMTLQRILKKHGAA